MKNLLLILLCLAVYQTTDAQKFRVIAQTHQVYDTTAKLYRTVDSTIYHYNTGNNKGSSQMADTINFDTSKTYLLINGTLSLYPGYTYKKYNTTDLITFKATHHDTGILNDDRYTYYPNNQLKKQEHYNYTSVNKWPPFIYQYMITGMNYYEYNSNGAVSMHISGHYAYNIPNPYPTDTTYNTYDGNGRLTKDSSIIGNGGTAINLYTYNAAGKVSIQTHITTLFDTARYYFYYNTSGLLITDSSFNGAQQLTRAGKHSYNSFGDPIADTITQYLNGKIAYITTTHRTYILNRLIKTYTTQEYDSAFHPVIVAPGVAHKNIYYYGHYWPNSITEQNSYEDITLYPNPTTNNTSISIQLAKAATLSTTVTDITGRAVVQTRPTLYSKGKNNIQLQTSKLPAATYIVNIKNKQGALLYSSKLIKQ